MPAVLGDGEVPDPPVVQGRRVRVGAHELLVRDSGGPGEPVLLAHGWPDDSTLWRHQQAALAREGYRAVSFDWLGHGGSDAPRETRHYSVPRLSEQLVGLLDALGVDRAHLVAHDYGATVAWEAVPRFPGRFITCTAISVGHPLEGLRDIATGALLRYRWLLLHGLPSSRSRYLADDARRFRRAFASHPDGERILARLRADDDPWSFIVWEKGNPAPAVVARLLRSSTPRRLPLPTSAVFSVQDEWMTEGQLARSGRYVDGPWTYHRVDGGHWLPLERPAVVTDLVLAHLRRHGARARPHEPVARLPARRSARTTGHP